VRIDLNQKPKEATAIENQVYLDCKIVIEKGLNRLYKLNTLNTNIIFEMRFLIFYHPSQFEAKYTFLNVNPNNIL